jgi:hypothetical protein
VGLGNALARGFRPVRRNRPRPVSPTARLGLSLAELTGADADRATEGEVKLDGEEKPMAKAIVLTFSPVTRSRLALSMRRPSI